MSTGKNLTLLRFTVTSHPYNAVGDGVTDDTAGIMAAIGDATDAGGTVVFPKPASFYRVTDTVVVTCAVEADAGAELRSTAATAVSIGAVGASLDYKRVVLPRVRREGSATSTGVGVEIVQADGCDIHLPLIYNFADGLVLDGDTDGVAYNAFHVGIVYAYTRSLVLRHSNGGWVNQNTFVGGRFTISQAGTAVPGVRQVQIGESADANFPNGNTFVGCSFEGDAPEYHLETFGNYNQFLNCRWETTAASTSLVHFASSARYNRIAAGFAFYGFTVTEDPSAISNTVEDDTGRHLVNVYDPRDTDDSGQFLRNQGSDLGPVLSVMRATADIFSSAVRKASWQVKLTSRELSMKSDTNTMARLVLSYLGKIHLGTGSASPDVTLERSGDSQLRVTGSATGTSPHAEVVEANTGESHKARLRIDVTGQRTRLDSDGGTGSAYPIQLTVGSAEVARFVETPAEGETALLVRRNVAGTFSTQKVTMGAADSAGVGYRTLRLPN